MARADERGEWSARGSDEGFLEGDPLVARQDRLADADQTITIAHRRRDVGNLVAAGLALFRRATQTRKRFHEEGLDVVGLEPARLGPLHFLTDPSHLAGVHRVVRERPLLQEILKLSRIRSEA